MNSSCSISVNFKNLEIIQRWQCGNKEMWWAAKFDTLFILQEDHPRARIETSETILRTLNTGGKRAHFGSRDIGRIKWWL